MKFEVEPIAYLKSCFKEKFAVPRQPGLAPSARGEVHLQGIYNNIELVEGLESCSHIWLQFVFHECLAAGWKSKVRPPRLGGNQKMGVLATRSTHRPNGIGLSVVELKNIEQKNSQVILHISGMDLIDGTPIVDIKPYIPYSDSLPHARYAFAQDAPSFIEVRFSHDSEQQLETHSQKQPELNLRQLIKEVLQQDPKPAFHQPDSNRIYGVKLENIELRWRYVEGRIEVVSIDPINIE